MTATSPEFVTLILLAAMISTGVFLWWCRQDDDEHIDSDVTSAHGLQGLFDELVQAAEDDGVFEDDPALAPRMANLNDITPIPEADEDDADIGEIKKSLEQAFAARALSAPALHAHAYTSL